MTSSLGRRRLVIYLSILVLERCGLRSVTRSLARSPLKLPRPTRPIIFTIPAESQVATGHLEWKIGHYSIFAATLTSERNPSAGAAPANPSRRATPGH